MEMGFIFEAAPFNKIKPLKEVIRMRSKIFLISLFIVMFLPVINCKSPITPNEYRILEIDIIVKYERVYQVDPSGYNWVFFEMEIQILEGGYSYRTVKLQEQSEGIYTGIVENVPTGSRFIAFIDDRMVFPLYGLEDWVRPIGRKVTLNDHECKSIVGSCGNERIRGRISESGQITDD